MTLRKKANGNISGRGVYAGKQHVILFLKYFVSLQKQIHILSHTEFVICKWFQSGQSKILLFSEE